MKTNFKHFEIAAFTVSLFCIIAILIMIVFIILRDNNAIRYQNLDVVFNNSDIISISNKLPLSDEIAKTYEGEGMEPDIEGYSTFTISNPNDKKVIYQIYITKQDTKFNYIKSDYINFYLTDENNNPYPGFDKNIMINYHDLYVLSDKPGSRLLYTSKLMAHKSEKFKLRMWLADSYGLTQNKEDFSVDIDVRIK